MSFEVITENEKGPIEYFLNDVQSRQNNNSSMLVLNPDHQDRIKSGLLV
jgi:hypothetical protein